MIEPSYFLFLLLFSNIFQINCIKYEASLEAGYNFTYSNYNFTNDILFGNIKFFKKDNHNYTFRNFPKSESKYNTFEKKNESGIFTAWPDKDNNFISIIDFEFDEDGNIYLLDEGYKSSQICLYKYDLNGEFKEKYEFFNGSYLLNNFVLDKINNYVYIPYYNYSSESYGILMKKLKNNNNDNYSYKNIDDSLFSYDIKYNFSNQLFKNYPKIINAALSCDGKYLLFCRLSSRMIYSIKTKKLRDTSYSIIKINDVNVAYKDDASSSLIYSNMGNLYLSGIERNAIYLANQIENDLTVFDFKIPDKCVIENMINENEYENIGATKLFISDGHLYINYKKIINKGNSYDIKTDIYSIKIGHDESYIYKCAGLIYNWKIIAYIFWGVFIVIVILVLLFVFIGNEQDKRINIKKNK